MSDLGNLDYGLGGNPNVYRTWSGNFSAAFSANVGAVAILGTLRNPGMYRADVTIVASVLATSALNTAFNITTTDAGGANTTPIPLWANGLLAASFDLGSFKRASGSYLFQMNGAGGVDVSISITGIVTPGSLAAVYDCVLTRVG
jgi:hypothetical protein